MPSTTESKVVEPSTTPQGDRSTHTILKTVAPGLREVFELFNHGTTVNYNDIIDNLISDHAAWLHNTIYEYALYSAARAGRTSAVEYILEHCSTEVKTGYWAAAGLKYAIYNNHLDTVTKMLVKGVDVNYRLPYLSMTPILHAANAGNMSMIDILAKNGADVYCLNQEGYSIITYFTASEEWEDMTHQEKLETLHSLEQYAPDSNELHAIIEEHTPCCELVDCCGWMGIVATNIIGGLLPLIGIRDNHAVEDGDDGGA